MTGPPITPLLEIEGLSVSFRSQRGDIRAVDHIDLSVERGETVAVVGESGSGKSLTALAVMRLTPRGSRVDADRLDLAGTDLRALDERGLQDVRGRRVAMVFQDPMSSLNGVLSIGRQITETLERHRGLRGDAARARALGLLELVEIANPERILRQYPHQLSGGMRQRVMIAMSLAGEPDLLIADEPTTALDVTIQAQILDLLRRVQREVGMALLLISHDLGVVAGIADRIVVMYAGRVVEEGRVADVFEHPVHPYTVGLLRTVRQLSTDASGRLESIPGQPPALGAAPPGCAFAPRCPHAIEICRAVVPTLRATGKGRAACHVFAP